MKKIRLFLGLLIAATTLVAFSSCEDILNGLLGDDTEEDSGDPVISSTEEETDASDLIYYDFKLTDDKKSFVYFTSNQKFSYTSPADGTKYENCCYQVSFARKGNTTGKWTLYTRPVASTKTLELVAKGTYTGCDPAAEGSMTLLDSDGNEVQILSLTKSDDNYTFKADVTRVNHALAASGEK